MEKTNDDAVEEFLVNIKVGSNGQDRMEVLRKLNHVLHKAGLCTYFSIDGRIGFTLCFCKFCGEPIDDYGECIGCGRNNLDVVNEDGVQT